MAVSTQFLPGFADVALYGPHMCAVEALIDGGDGGREPRAMSRAAVHECGSGAAAGCTLLQRAWEAGDRRAHQRSGAADGVVVTLPFHGPTNSPSPLCRHRRHCHGRNPRSYPLLPPASHHLHRELSPLFAPSGGTAARASHLGPVASTRLASAHLASVDPDIVASWFAFLASKEVG